MPQSASPLMPVEARVLAVLIEKEKTTPDQYPLSLNSLTAGCNQKTSRSPVMSLAESEVQAALEALRERELVSDGYGNSGRVLKYSHQFTRGFKVPGAAVALLAVLILRGPQTVNELRANCERLYPFPDASAVEGYLDELAARPAGALASKLPRQPGAREQRWAHLLCGVPALVDSPDQSSGPDWSARVVRLEIEVAELRSQVNELLDELRQRS